MNETKHTAPGPDGDKTFESTQAIFQHGRESRVRGARIPKAFMGRARGDGPPSAVAQTTPHLRVEGLCGP